MWLEAPFVLQQFSVTLSDVTHRLVSFTKIFYKSNFSVCWINIFVMIFFVLSHHRHFYRLGQYKSVQKFGICSSYRLRESMLLLFIVIPVNVESCYINCTFTKYRIPFREFSVCYIQAHRFTKYPCTEFTANYLWFMHLLHLTWSKFLFRSLVPKDYTFSPSLIVHKKVKYVKQSFLFYHHQFYQ